MRRIGVAAQLTLNRPRSINALTLEMVELIDRELASWETDPNVVCVIIDGAGERGLCAGGDIVMMRDSILNDEARLARAFWRAEYRLDARIASYPKPVVTAMDGIVMGGGVGLACHSSHRLASERLALAMPEVGIGLHPDCGAAFLLARAPGELGAHLILTGRRIDAADSLYCGLVDWVVAADSLPELPELLSDGRVEEIAERLPRPPNGVGPPSLERDRAWIDIAYRGDSVEAILTALRGRPESAAKSAAAEIETKSPTSLKVSLAALRRARAMPNVGYCFAQDYRVSTGCAADPDFPEGVRAQIVDKDREPRWDPATLAGVDQRSVDRHFCSVPDELGLELT